MTRCTATTLLAAFTVACFLPTKAFAPATGEVFTCSHYTQANTAAATCNDRPNIVCLQKCSGAVVVDGCTLGQTAGPSTQQTCTISYGRTSAVQSICENQQGSFLCTGTPSGQATCSGCVDTTLTDFLPTVPSPGQPPLTPIVSGPANLTSSPALNISVTSQNGTSANTTTATSASATPATAVIVTGSAIPPPPTAQFGKPSQSASESKHTSSSATAASATTNQADGDPASTSNSSSTNSNKTSGTTCMQASNQVIITLSLIALGFFGLS